jgi:hypothetical protein
MCVCEREMFGTLSERERARARAREREAQDICKLSERKSPRLASRYCMCVRARVCSKILYICIYTYLCVYIPIIISWNFSLSNST